MGDNNIDRREFLKRAAKAGIAIGAVTGGAFLLHNRDAVISAGESIAKVKDFRITGDALPQMAIAKGDSPAKIVKAAVEGMGGMKRFVSRGDIVVIKPNIGWDRAPEQAANTNPEVVAETVRLCYDAGAKKVIVTDMSCNDPRRCFFRSGIGKSAKDAGADVQLPKDYKFRKMAIKGDVLKVWPVYTVILEADKIINIPIAKHHNHSTLTLGMKNWYGLLGGRRKDLHQNIHMSIADLASFIHPTLTIIDAYRILIKNGPQGGSIRDVRMMNTVAVSTDPVAVDAFATTLFDKKPEEIGYIVEAYKRGLGNINYTELKPVIIST
ncbi:MAG: cytoplasmic protein [Nitrospinae bacterium RIFCSPLOWO2_01_FULL_39_10]|nr:MAG: cytoplasmic protein [Nitrospinae bacterium RIFCSPLOWO2_01_FULL_39_10]